MKTPFNIEEIKQAVEKLKNNKSPGKDKIKAEQIKPPKILYKIIADMFNHMAKTGKYPIELTEGLIIPIQKQGKQKGKIENLRPITLLNQIRKILSIVMLNRINSRIDNEINITQTAYRSGRSVTENVFTFKILAEKAISTSNNEINVTLFDMSKAFDTVNRPSLMQDLKKVLGEDELHILSIMINEVQIQIKTKTKLGRKFQTNNGIPQGDCLSPILFTLYLSKILYPEHNKYDHSYASINIGSEHILEKPIMDHSYMRKPKLDVKYDQRFADPIGYLKIIINHTQTN